VPIGCLIDRQAKNEKNVREVPICHLINRQQQQKQELAQQVPIGHLTSVPKHIGPKW